MKQYQQYEFSIKEIAEMYHISTRAIRFYEEKGLIQPKRLDNQYRVYDLACLDRLEMIISLKRSGLSLEKISALLNDELNNQEVYLQQKQVLDKKMRELKSAQSFIDEQLQMITLLNQYGLKNLFTIRIKRPENHLVQRWQINGKGVYVEVDERMGIGYDPNTKEMIGLFQSSTQLYEQTCAFYFFVQNHTRSTNQYVLEMIDLLHAKELTAQSPIFISTYGAISKDLVTLAWCKIKL